MLNPQDGGWWVAGTTSSEGLNESGGSTFEVAHSHGWQVGNNTCWLGI